jgi:hypothetical protein
MSHSKKTSLVLCGLFSLGFLTLGLFTNGILSRAARHVPSLFKAVSHTNGSAVQFNSPVTTGGRVIFEKYGEPTPPTGSFATAKQMAESSFRSIVPLFFRVILTPKVSRHIFKSVLNI